MRQTLKNRYELVQELSVSGGVSAFRARDKLTGAPCLVKRFAPQSLSGDPLESGRSFRTEALRGLFRAEAQLLSQVKHDAIPRVLDFIDEGDGDDDSIALVLEWIEGETLRERINARHPCSEDQVLSWMRDLLLVLGHLHERVPAVVHGNIRPENVIIGTDGKARLIDFGALRQLLAKSDGQVSRSTSPYAPPEATAGRATPAQDLYALAMTLVHAASLVSPAELAREHGRVVLPSSLRLSWPARAVFERMLSPDEKARFANADAVLSVVKALQKNPLTGRNRTRAIAIGAACAAFALGAVSYVGLARTCVLPEPEPRLPPAAMERPMSITLPTTTWSAQQPITIHFSTTDASKTDWITIVPAGSPENNYREWHYTDGANEGEMSFQALPPGSYEVRGYLDWPRGDYFVRARATVVVQDVPLVLPAADVVLHDTRARVLGDSQQPFDTTVWATKVQNVSTEYARDRWSKEQVLSAPNVFPAHGDLHHAWASRDPDQGLEWITVRFPKTKARALQIVQTFNPGAIVRVDDLVHDENGKDVVTALWTAPCQLSADDACEAPRGASQVLELELAEPRTIESVRVLLNTRLVPGWNELDAIGLVPTR